jgi:hypothetical protein
VDRFCVQDPSPAAQHNEMQTLWGHPLRSGKQSYALFARLLNMLSLPHLQRPPQCEEWRPPPRPSDASPHWCSPSSSACRKSRTHPPFPLMGRTYRGPARRQGQQGALRPGAGRRHCQVRPRAERHLLMGYSDSPHCCVVSGRVGLAISDPTFAFAWPLANIKRQPNKPIRGPTSHNSP